MDQEKQHSRISVRVLKKVVTDDHNEENVNRWHKFLNKPRHRKETNGSDFTVFHIEKSLLLELHFIYR